MSTHFKYRADIDGLRAIAVIGVVLFHAFPNSLPGGFVGVDVFFVISGYLISRILFREFSEKTFTYADFYTRRITRIFPSLIVMLLSVWAIGWFTFTSAEFKLLGRHVFSSALFLQNINLLRESGYFDLNAEFKPLLHLWSLAIEEQFYIFWPPLIGLLIAMMNRAVPRVLGFLILISFCLGVIRMAKHPESAFYEIQFRCWELLIGAFVARIDSVKSVATKTTPASLISQVLSVAGLMLLVISFGFISKERSFPGYWALLPVFGSAFLIAAGPVALVNRVLLARRALVAIGLISYPLYLWHWPLLSISKVIAPTTAFDSREGIVARCILVAAAFVFAIGSFALLEKPLKKWMQKRKREQRTLLPLTAGLVLIFSVLGLAGRTAELENGFPSRFAAIQMAKHKAPASELDPTLRDCNAELQTRGIEWCLTNAIKAKTEQADVVLIGDSHARMFASALARYYAKQGRKLHSFGLGETIGLIDTGVEMGGAHSTNGIRSLSFAFDWAINNKAKTIVLASRGPAYAGRPVGGLDDRRIQTVSLSKPQLRDPEFIFREGLKATFNKTAVAKVETIFIYENPEIGFDPKTFCIERPFTFLNRFTIVPCAVNRERVEADQALYRSIVKTSVQAFPNVKVYDLNSKICDSSRCFAIDGGGNAVYADDNHLSDFGVQKALEGYHF